MYLYLPLIRMKTRRGEFLEANHLVEQLHLSAQASGSAIFIAHSAFECMRLAFAKGNGRELERWSRHFSIEERMTQALDPANRMLWEIREHWVMAGIIQHLHRNQLDRARTIAQQLLYLNVDHGYPIRFLPINMCIAYLDFRIDQISAAFKRLNDTLTQADATGMVSGLFDDIPGMDDFINAALAQQRIHHPEHIARFQSLDILTLSPPAAANPTALDPVETRIAQHIRQGGTTREIAQQLLMSEEAITWHLGNICYKLDLEDSAELKNPALM